jgi:hypothetical protein
MTRRRSVAIVAVVLATSAIAIMACSDGNRPAPSGASGGVYGSTSGASSSASGGSSTSSGSSGADGSAEGGGACDGPTQLGEPLGEMRFAGDAPPPLGGVLADGTYILSSRDAFGAPPTSEDGGGAADSGSGGSSDVKRATMVIFGATMKFSASKGPAGSTLPADTVTGFSFATAGTTINATPVCPAGPPLTIPYSAVGTGIALYLDSTHRELYVRQ